MYQIIYEFIFLLDLFDIFNVEFLIMDSNIKTFDEELSFCSWHWFIYILLYGCIIVNTIYIQPLTH